MSRRALKTILLLVVASCRNLRQVIALQFPVVAPRTNSRRTRNGYPPRSTISGKPNTHWGFGGSAFSNPAGRLIIQHDLVPSKVEFVERTSHRTNDLAKRFSPWRLLRKCRKRWIVLGLVAAAAAFWPTRTASAAEPFLESVAEPAAAAATVAAETAAGAATAPALSYSSNPPLSLLAVSPPMSQAAEIRLSFRLIMASLIGAAVGKERSGSPRHAAGVRTMALVSLGAAAFTVCSMYGFAAAGRYDPSRMASNVASGVGFVGAGVITTTSSHHGDRQESIVHGLTTAAAIWLSAAIGVACGVGLYYVASVASLSTIAILRVGRVANKLQETRIRRKEKHNGSRSSSSSNSSSNSIQSRSTANNISVTAPVSEDPAAFQEVIAEDRFVYHPKNSGGGWNNETDSKMSP